MTLFSGDIVIPRSAGTNFTTVAFEFNNPDGRYPQELRLSWLGQQSLDLDSVDISAK